MSPARVPETNAFRLHEGRLPVGELQAALLA
jgi:hypothetical protein